MALADGSKKSMNINLGVGENRHKTTLKYGLSLGQEGKGGVRVELDVRLKKKAELKTMLQNELVKMQRLEEYNLFKLCKVEF